MKIGIITFHRPENFGSALQAFALKEYLRKLGHESAVIDFVFPRDLKQYRLFRTHVYIQRPWSILGDIVYLRRNIQKKKRFHDFRKKYLNLTDSYVYQKNDLSELNNEFDAFICGSDQIWNLDCTGGVVPEYFLGFANDNKLRISYAPSMPEKPSKQYYDTLIEYLNKFDYLSVRENSTKTFFENELKIKRPVEHVLDPTLLLSANDYIKSFGLEKKNKKYIFVYILGNTEIKQSIAQEANRKSEETGLPIKYVMVRRVKGLENGSYCLGIGPVDFLDFVFNASYVITDSFHASVFAILFQVPFCTFAREGTFTRMQELLTNLELSCNYCSSDMHTNIAYKSSSEETEKLIQMYKTSSDAYIRKSLSSSNI